MSGATQFAAGSRVTAAALNLNLAQPWTALTLMNSWVNAGGSLPGAKCRLINQVELEIIGALNPGTITNPVVIASIPSSAMWPLSTQNIQWSIFAASSLAPSTALLEVTNTGAVTAYNVPATTPGIGFHGFIALDV